MHDACASARHRRDVDKRTVETCMTTATDVYYNAVDLFGHTAYHHLGNTETYCGHSWVESCLPA